MSKLISDGNRAIQRKPVVLLAACKNVDLAVNLAKTKYLEVGRHKGMTVNEHVIVVSNSTIFLIVLIELYGHLINFMTHSIPGFK